MDRRILLSLIIFAISIMLFTCNPQPDMSWFTLSPCEAPCWFNVVPGETLKEEIVPILQAIPGIDPDSIGNRGFPIEIFDDVYFFDLHKSLEGEIWLLDNRVSEILLTPKKNGYTKKYSLGLTLGEIIDKYGEPDYVLLVRQLGPGLLPISDAMHPIMVLINAERGIVTVYDAYYFPEKVRNLITADIKISYLKYFFPDDFDRLLEAGAFSFFDTRIKLQPWHGYGEYPAINQ
jgi:hypothetical protein